MTRNVLIHVKHGKRGLLFERLYDLAEDDLAEALGFQQATCCQLMPPD